MGHSAVPTHWYPYTLESGNYLEINKNMDGSSMKQHLRNNYLQYWTVTYQALPTETGEGATPAPPTGDSEATSVPATGDSEATPTTPAGDSEPTPATPAGDSEVAQMPIVIGF